MRVEGEVQGVYRGEYTELKTTQRHNTCAQTHSDCSRAFLRDLMSHDDGQWQRRRISIEVNVF
jgi:hypothetical protein